jgi:hypothetical protein
MQHKHALAFVLVDSRPLISLVYLRTIRPLGCAELKKNHVAEPDKASASAEAQVGKRLYLLCRVMFYFG